MDDFAIFSQHFFDNLKYDDFSGKLNEAETAEISWRMDFEEDGKF